ncbi:MAG: uridine diphosphate-N-acetylglucosamine-binding protein YvcK [Dactylosporangium sp.]|nr:uridine diphosphate-N-acetylglucosamine-binding protein YvcK [Dactylosporangium sp.]NNJ60749.1 uridine diphosphate-N-acetylglucosamine-binding protein YvcK [Dactylosporangium sp.]
MTGPRSGRIVAFGGGHGLAASLRALRVMGRTVPLDITAVVTVGDDGGSSGRLRADRGGLPPGDLRQALAALADGDDELAWRTAELLQHRFAGEDSLAGHAVGNLLLCGLMELLGDPVGALDHAAALLRCHGRVLPMSRQPVGIEADVFDADSDRPGETVVVRGQHRIAVSQGTVTTVRLTPQAPRACVEAVEAVSEADWLIFGPGSWYTSVIPHLLVPDLADAVVKSPAKRLVTLNLATDNETAGLSLPGHLAALRRYLPALRVDVVIADPDAIGDPTPVRCAAESLGARLVLAPVAMATGAAYHDPAALAAVMGSTLGSME